MLSYSISIVICTVDRCHSLRNTLNSIAEWQSSFSELIVVHGPSQDETNDLLQEYEHLIDKVIVTASKNVSVARNLGLKEATQDIVMYLDDDVIPPQDWLETHLSFYKLYGQKCGCVAGDVRDKTKPDAPLQFSRGVNSLLSESKPILSEDTATKYLSSPYWFSAVMGANASYRRDALLKIGGFDEFFEYFLEETDVCLRLIQSGYKVYYTENTVDHYPAQSHNRQDQKHLTCWYSLGKNTTYFALKHAFHKIPFPILITRLYLLLNYRCFLRIIRLKFIYNLSNKLILKYLQESIEGIRVGWTAGFALHKVNSN
ncbi:putative glycosyltransferase [Nostoc sp. PCC 7524]|uniref:glycosyltransferase family 2 protein n=1 Tax=Nostoc sp. (strain ATCC 29411 / PCC 7524) TaxID=28072 RepID=UPI00029EFB7E|nr:glycosyltransferase family 2 protein [Nostoc sp. PCC 7524]AFY48359.1 putative glycosyltransferase [Nostoc sp. PCC 7524]